jgi:hypothetical protein
MGLACASCVARSRIRSGTSRESGMVPPYGYNSRKNTFLPPYSHAVLTSMGCTQLLRSSLLSPEPVIRFFPVPPSTRLAAGPLTENLPHVYLSDRNPVDLSLESPSPRGTMRRLSTCVLPAAFFAGEIFACCRRIGLRMARTGTKRGHLA